MQESFDLLLAKVFMFQRGSFTLSTEVMLIPRRFWLHIVVCDTTLVSLGVGAHLEELHMQIIRSFSIIAMHFLEIILRGLLGYLKRGFRFSKWVLIIPLNLKLKSQLQQLYSII